MPRRTAEERRQASREAMARRRQNESFREQERIRDSIAHSLRRLNPDLRSIERRRDAIAHHFLRSDAESRREEQIRDTAAHQLVRSDPGRRQTEQTRNTFARQIVRSNPERRRAEQTRDTSARQLVRSNPERRRDEQTRDTSARRIVRSDPGRRQTEQARNTSAHQLLRSDQERRMAEQAVNTSYRRKRRSDGEFRDRERLRENRHREESRANQSFESQLLLFLAALKEGPTKICTCCGGLFFHNSVRKFSTTQMNKFSESFVSSVNNHPSESPLICHTCWKDVEKGKVPKLSESNGFYYPPIPPELQCLTPLEERLCAARIPFMQIRSLSIDRQLGLRGSIVNVWNPVNETVKVLPRKFSESSTIQLAFMRRLEYNHPYMYESIRPSKVYRAAKYLTTTPLYQDEGIILSDEWAERLEEDTENFITSPEDIPATSPQQSERPANVDDSAVVLETPSGSNFDESESEDETENAVSEESMFHQPEVFQGIKYAPGQGQTPISILRDSNAEVLSFPTIYCGEPRPLKPDLKVSYTDIVKSESRRYDRRGCTPVHILYQYKLLQIQRIHDAVGISLRKKKVGKATAGEIRNPESLNEMINHDDGYRVLKGITSSPAHWEDQKKNLMAMIRQISLPTFFLTMSAAEQHWPELIIILEKIINHREISVEDVDSMSWDERSSLIRREPVICAEYFDYRFRSFKSILLSAGFIFDEYEVEDSYERTEFQHRGSPHKHCLLWNRNAPKFDERDPSTFQPVCDFVDRFITTENHPEFARYQSHKHSFSCYRNTRKGRICRFGIPIPPMKKTVILLPNKTERSPEQRRMDQDNLVVIKEKLRQIRRKKRMNILFDDFLQDINVNEEVYLHAVRSSIDHPTIFLKRNADAAYINAYNTRIARAWGANIDIQFILDPWACAKYVVQYVNKSAGGVSKLLRKAAEDIKRGNFKLRDRLWHIGKCFLNGVEVSAPEAAWGVLGLPMSICSRATAFIPTSLPSERVCMVKAAEELNKLDSNSTDVTLAGPLEHYLQRPPELEPECLASFCARYEFSRRRPQISSKSFQARAEEDQQVETNIYRLNDGSGYIRRRTKSKIIRFRNYRKHIDEPNFYREKCMLYLPWRNEEKDILSKDCKSLFNANIEEILRNKAEFDPVGSIDMASVQELVDEEEQEQDEDEGIGIDEEYRSFFADETDANIFGESSSTAQHPFERFTVSPLVPDDEYLILVRSLNTEQRLFFNHWLSIIRAGLKENCEYLAGGAGTGKTRLIKAIVQAVYRHELSKPGHDPSLPSVLLCAPTGKAAFGIGGVTIHTAFSLPLNQSSLNPLDPSTRNTLYSQLIQVTLIIMDEVSMCSARHLQWIDQRLREIFGSDLPFAGINILVVGDFHQLRPVCGSFIFCSTADKLGQICGPTLWRLFKFYELHEIMRQKEDRDFAEALNNLAIGSLTDDQINLFKSRVIQSNNLLPPKKALRLFGTNPEVKEFNTISLNSLNTEGTVAVAKDLIHGTASAATKSALLEKVRNLDPKKTQNLLKEILLKIGARYMITINVDTSDGLVNGSTGVLGRIIYGKSLSGNEIPIKIYLTMDEETAGKRARTLNPSSADAEQLTPISVARKEIYSWPGRKLSVTRVQFPVAPAEALTWWKAQGMTCNDGVVVKLRSRMERSAQYVACSRSPSLDLLYLDGEFVPPAKPAPNDPVESELTRLRSEAALILSPPPQELPEQNIKIFFHNVQSLNAHLEDIRTNSIIMNCDILLLVETWTLPQDDLQLPDFVIKSRLDCSNVRKPFGYMVYSKNEITLNETQAWNQIYKGAHCELVLLNAGNFDILLGYKSPKMPSAAFLEVLREPLLLTQGRRILFMGDYNLDLHSDVSSSFKRLLNENGLLPLLPGESSSTSAGTLIDVAFSNDRSIICSFSETVYSHHKPIIANIPT